MNNLSKNKSITQKLWLFIIAFLGIGCFLFIKGMEIYKTECSHSAGYRHIQKYDISKQDFVLQQKIPLTEITGLNWESYNSTWRLYLQTTRDKFPIEAMYSSINGEERYLNVTSFYYWLNDKTEDTFIYQEKRYLTWFSLIFIILGLFFLCIKMKITKMYDKPTDNGYYSVQQHNYQYGETGIITQPMEESQKPWYQWISLLLSFEQKKGHVWLEGETIKPKNESKWYFLGIIICVVLGLIYFLEK